MRALTIVAAAALAGSCTRPAVPPGSDFAAQTEGRIAGPAQSCISNNSSENLHVLDPQTLAYGTGRTIYVNRLNAQCPAMSEVNTIIIQPSLGGQYCRGDLVRGLEPGATIPGPTCILGDWVPYRRP